MVMDIQDPQAAAQLAQMAIDDPDGLAAFLAEQGDEPPLVSDILAAEKAATTGELAQRNSGSTRGNLAKTAAVVPGAPPQQKVAVPALPPAPVAPASGVPLPGVKPEDMGAVATGAVPVPGIKPPAPQLASAAAAAAPAAAAGIPVGGGENPVANIANVLASLDVPPPAPPPAPLAPLAPPSARQFSPEHLKTVMALMAQGNAGAAPANPIGQLMAGLKA